MATTLVFGAALIDSDRFLGAYVPVYFRKHRVMVVVVVVFTGDDEWVRSR